MVLEQESVSIIANSIATAAIVRVYYTGISIINIITRSAKPSFRLGSMLKTNTFKVKPAKAAVTYNLLHHEWGVYTFHRPHRMYLYVL